MMNVCVGMSPQTRSFRSSGFIRSRSASELLPDGKRPSFLASRRFAPDNPTQTFQLSINTQYSNKNFLVLFLVWTRGHLLFQLLVIKH